MNDLDLLNLIEKNAKLSVEDLSVMLDEEKIVVERELTKLEKERIICGYHTIINWDKTSKDNVSALIFARATPERDFGYDNIAKKIYSYPEVESMYLVSGDYDFILRLKTNTMNAVGNFVATKLACIEGISKTNTLLVLKTYKSNNEEMNDFKENKERLIVTP